MPWNPGPTRDFGPISGHTSGSGESSTDSGPLVHRTTPAVHRKALVLWRDGARGRGPGPSWVRDRFETGFDTQAATEAGNR
jgi:hypothetical protein